jgi:hypothetical protein
MPVLAGQCSGQVVRIETQHSTLNGWQPIFGTPGQFGTGGNNGYLKFGRTALGLEPSDHAPGTM